MSNHMATDRETSCPTYSRRVRDLRLHRMTPQPPGKTLPINSPGRTVELDGRPRLAALPLCYATLAGRAAPSSRDERSAVRDWVPSCVSLPPILIILRLLDIIRYSNTIHSSMERVYAERNRVYKISSCNPTESTRGAGDQTWSKGSSHPLRRSYRAHSP